MLRIQGGTVYDPANGVDGVVKDIVLDGGKVVADGTGGRTIDAAGMIVFPGGVDVHTHVAGAGLNFARSMIPEEHRQSSPILRSRTTRAGIGGPTPTSFATGYLYAGMGWTTVNEAAVPMLTAKRTHDELHDTPIVDKTCCVLMGNNELVLDLLERGEYERAKQVVAWYLWAAKGYGIKVVNAGGVAAWKWGKDAKKLTDVVEGYHSLTPGTIVGSLARIIEELKLPHAMHLHCNNLGAPGNVGTTLETMKTLEGSRAHLAHLQYHAYGGGDWESISSAAPAVADYFNAHPNLTTDVGAVLFGNAITLSADGPWQYLLYQLTGKKWGNIDVENETGCGVVPYVYREKNIVNAVQWATGLELLLLIDDPWRVALTTDHPNGTSFWRYPEILHLLMDASFRNEEFAKLPEKARARTCLADLKREYTLFEIAILTSAGPARTLGLSQKGHLGVGADADVAVYHAHKNPATLFAHPRYVIKGGEVVVEDGDVRTTPDSRGFVTKPGYDPAIEDYLRPIFRDHYTVAFENYPVELTRIPRPVVRDV